MPHINKLIDYTTCAFIVNRKKVLLCKHKKLGKWLPLGGHIELDEDPDEGLFREIKEECGLTEKQLTPVGEKLDFVSEGTKFLLTPNRVDIHQIDSIHRHVGLIYYFLSNTDKITLETVAHEELRWAGIDDLGKLEPSLSKSIRFYAREAIKLASLKT